MNAMITVQSPMPYAKYTHGGAFCIGHWTWDNKQRIHNLTFNFGNNAFFQLVKLPSRIRSRASFISAR